MAKVIYVDNNGNEKVLRDGNIWESDILFRDDYFAMKRWSREDIEGRMRELGYKVTEERVDSVIESGGKWYGLNDCDDGEWNCIDVEIENALGEPDVVTDQTMAILREEFDEQIEGVEKESGCWRVYVENENTEEGSETEGDIHDDTTWDDFFDWLIGDIKEMGIGSLDEIHIIEVYYAGKDEEWED